MAIRMHQLYFRIIRDDYNPKDYDLYIRVYDQVSNRSRFALTFNSVDEMTAFANEMLGMVDEIKEQLGEQ